MFKLMDKKILTNLFSKFDDYTLARFLPLDQTGEGSINDVLRHRTLGSMPGVGLEVKSSTYLKDWNSALKFSRSPYFDNHVSESIHTCTIDTL